MVQFDEQWAKYFGVEKAIIYNYVYDLDKPFKASDLMDVFPFWSKQRIARLLGEMAREDCLIEFSSYKEYAGDNRKWYENLKEDE